MDTLWIDSVGFATLSLDENAKPGAPLKFKGKFQEGNAVNKNRRMYPTDVLKENVERLQESIKNRGLVGQLDHPSDSVIHFEKASHIVSKLWWDGNILMGEGEVLPTPAGRVLKSLIESGVRVGISSRGVGNGTTNEEGVLVIGESYRLITFDAVADPSCQEAFQQKIANEAVKNEASRINTVNKKALISYLGCAFESRIKAVKEQIRKI